MCLLADMAELADALDLGSSGESRAGSSPVIRRQTHHNPRIYGDSRGTSAPPGRLYALCKERQQIGTFKRLTRNKSRSFLRFDISWAWKHIEN